MRFKNSDFKMYDLKLIFKNTVKCLAKSLFDFKLAD
jgi:hypothetical protein